ncbi:hypothetical protein M422DRAFT_272360 [Sphaerobolus stellatus SS14]|uniref:Major facilitator superfamily (MFS) profile domain-containing protein n=1 Tax=Sphaerobolus stellatus (strain SS14) TaxID=990650 RepID=A0A0C9UMN5_SPHS4|nr:hypothetical protein M422DRAFT_272360 [Sphaerobolus stellatus SS14]
MPLGILNDMYLDQVPGTVALVHKRKAQSGLNEVIMESKLVNDPLNPLNWPRWRKECVFWILTFRRGPWALSGFQRNGAPLLIGYRQRQRIHPFHGLYLVRRAVKYGGRPVYLTATLLLFFGSIWSGLFQVLQSFTGSRIIQGFGMAAFESIMTASIEDIYFVHQGGPRTAIWCFGLTAGINVAPIVNGCVVSSPSLGWRFCFWIISFLFGVLCLLVIFLVPETMYRRDHRYLIEPNGASDLGLKKAPSNETSNLEDVFEEAAKSSLGEKDLANTFIFAVADLQIHIPGHNMKLLLPWSGYKDKKSLFKLFLRPFPFLLSPVVFYGAFIFDIMFICSPEHHYLHSIRAVTLSFQNSSSYSLIYSTRQVGLVSIGPLVGSLIGAIISEPLSDRVVTTFAKINKGIYGPEARLLLTIPMFIFQVGGWAIFASKGVHWIGPVMMYTIINLGQNIGNTAAIAYIIDVHRENAAECFAIINFIKDVVLYGFAQFVKG